MGCTGVCFHCDAPTVKGAIGICEDGKQMKVKSYFQKFVLKFRLGVTFCKIKSAKVKSDIIEIDIFQGFKSIGFILSNNCQKEFKMMLSLSDLSKS